MVKDANVKDTLFAITVIDSLKYAMVSILHGFETFTKTDVSYVRSFPLRCHCIEKLISQNPLTLMEPAERSTNSPDLNPVDLGISGMIAK